MSGLDPWLVVPTADPSALADRLLAAAGHLPDRAVCRAYAEQFDWAHVAREHASLYAEVTPLQRTRVVYLTTRPCCPVVSWR